MAGFYNINMLSISAPVRVDIGGGVTDIPEFAREVGTSVLNIGVDVFADIQRNKLLPIHLNINAISSSSHRLIYNGIVHELDDIHDSLLFLKEFISSKISIDLYPCSFSFVNGLPQSTGLGSSAALSCLMTVACNRLKGVSTDPDTIIKLAHQTEVEELGVTGGFQDFIATYFGKSNYIDFNSLHDTDLNTNHSLGKALPEKLISYLNETMMVVINKKDNISSDVVVKDEIHNFYKNKPETKINLEIIKESNTKMKDVIFANASPEAILSHIGDLMILSWSAQKKLSRFVGSDMLSAIERVISEHVYGYRGPGTGANSLFFICKLGERKKLMYKLQKFADDVEILFLKVNESGIVFSHDHD